MKKREVVRVCVVIDKENKEFADNELYNLSAFVNKALSSYRKKVQKENKEKEEPTTSHNIYCVNKKQGYNVGIVEEEEDPEEDPNDLPF